MKSISLLLFCLNNHYQSLNRSCNSLIEGRLLLLTALSLGLLIASNPLAFGASATLSWSANTEADLSGYNVYYGTSSGNYGVPISVGNTISHTITGLADGTYYFSVTAYDTSGNESGFSNEASKILINGPVGGSGSDITAPVITGVSAQSITGNTATIIWTSDEPASSQVDFGLTTAYGSSSTKNETLVTSHSQVITGLAEGTSYHFRVRSTDVSTNTATSNDATFSTSTSQNIDSTAPADIEQFSAVGENRQMVLTWINPPDTDFVGVHIRFRTDHFPIDINDGALFSDTEGAPGQNMQIIHSGLAEGTTYYYLAATYDGSGNFQTTAFVSGTTNVIQSSNGAASSGGGGCGMIRPGGGDPPKPGDAVGILTVIGLMMLTLLKKNMGRQNAKLMRI